MNFTESNEQKSEAVAEAKMVLDNKPVFLFSATRVDVLKLLEQQKSHDQLLGKLDDIGVSAHNGFCFSCLDFVADAIGVPSDNTVETRACEIANATGKWPENAYSRDWIYHEWGEVVDGNKAVEQFLDDLLSE